MRVNAEGQKFKDELVGNCTYRLNQMDNRGVVSEERRYGIHVSEGTGKIIV